MSKKDIDDDEMFGNMDLSGMDSNISRMSMQFEKLAKEKAAKKALDAKKAEPAKIQPKTVI